MGKGGNKNEKENNRNKKRNKIKIKKQRIGQPDFARTTMLLLRIG